MFCDKIQAMAVLRDYQPIKSAALKCLDNYPDVLAAYLFGSLATGRMHSQSDIDIAVLVSDDIVKGDPFRYRLRLMGDLMSDLGRNDVDLILLNEAPPLLAHRVLRDGHLILERSAAARVRFQIRTVNRYLDTQPMRNFYLARLKKDAAEGNLFG